MPSELTRLRVSVVCYACVSGHFADLCNPKFRGPNFRWERFESMMQEQSVDWMFLHHVKGDKDEIEVLARQYSGEIARRLLDGAGFLKAPTDN